MGERARYLLTTEVELLRAWGRELRGLFDEMPYLVGSALQHKDYRDVDVRIILDDDEYDKIVWMINPRVLNLMMSLWGQRATGMPIDCQIQRMTEANEEFGELPRDPIGIGVRLLDDWNKGVPA